MNLCLVQNRQQTPGRAQLIFADNVKRTRKLRGYTQQQLADRAQLESSYVSSVERGIRDITICNMERIAIALDVTVRDLVSEVHSGDVANDQP
ncbi:helix-turn-helix transcriptional regulator [Massilia sp. MP_M2]|uniref:helix-turn-helix domain-containing protein n=1 Tax=Massilia sp. MP_M2 TaxID=3071713 RepID=UPI00319E066C